MDTTNKDAPTGGARLTDERILTMAADSFMPIRFPHEVLAFARSIESEVLASRAPAGLEGLTEQIRTALRRAYDLGQTYWQQADSDYASQHKKADVTAGRFIELVNSTVADVERWAASHAGVKGEPGETLKSAFAEALHYPKCWDTAAYPALSDALSAVYAHFKCSECAATPSTAAVRAAALEEAASVYMVGAVAAREIRKLINTPPAPQQVAQASRNDVLEEAARAVEQQAQHWFQQAGEYAEGWKAGASDNAAAIRALKGGEHA